MKSVKERSIAILLLVAMLASLMCLPAMAAEAEDTTTETSANLMAEDTPAEEVTAPVPEVTILEDDEPDISEAPAAEPEASPETEESPAEEASVETAEASEEQEPVPEAAEEPAEDVEEASGEPSEEPVSDGGGSFTVRYYSGTELIHTEIVPAGEVPSEIPVSDSSDKAINGWLTTGGDDGAFVTVSKKVIEEDTDFYAWYAPALESEEHIRYINGVGNACFSPEGTLTRAQAATILYNLLETKTMGAYSCTFSDVTSGQWYYDAVSTLASWKVITGYSDGTFRPNRVISRAEFVTMVVRFYGVTSGTTNFTDVSESYWAYDSIATAVSKGWIEGYKQTDDTYLFKPSNSIKRCEAVTIVNRVLGRSADENTLSTGENILHYLDVSESKWYYAQVMEASIGHEYTSAEGGETWTSYNVESCGLTAGSHTISGNKVFVDADTLQLVHFTKRIQEEDGKYLYSSSDGYYYNGELSDYSPKAGFNLKDKTLFYWDADKKAPVKFSAGVNAISGCTYGYYADEDGYVLRNNFTGGVVELNGKKYISDGACGIITKQYDAINEKWVDLKNDTFEYIVKDVDKGMYFVQSDYSLLCDGWNGYLYFGEDGAFTTGDATMDGYLNTFCGSVIKNNMLTDVQKLLKIYYNIRGGNGSTYSTSQFSYRQTGKGYVYGSYTDAENYDWIIDSAKEFYVKKSGMCYNWACFYLFCARRLGFQAYPVVGTVFTNSRHCWCMIKWDGVWHISDVEVEWGYIASYYTYGRSIYWNLFDQKYYGGYTYVNPECSSIVYKFRYRSEDSIYL